MNDAIEILKLLVTDGILSDYALGGGIAATFYMEPVLTYDLDIARLSDLLRDHELSEKWQSLAKQEQ